MVSSTNCQKFSELNISLGKESEPRSQKGTLKLASLDQKARVSGVQSESWQVMLQPVLERSIAQDAGLHKHSCISA